MPSPLVLVGYSLMIRGVVPILVTLAIVSIVALTSNAELPMWLAAVVGAGSLRLRGCRGVSGFRSAASLTGLCSVWAPPARVWRSGRAGKWSRGWA